MFDDETIVLNEMYIIKHHKLVLMILKRRL